MKNTYITSILLVAAMTTIVGCNDSAPSSPEAVNAGAGNSTALSPATYDSLREACKSAKAVFDETSLECMCSDGMFTTIGDAPKCTRVEFLAASGNVELTATAKSGDLQTGLLVLDPMGNSYDRDLALKTLRFWSERETQLASHPFRLAVYGANALEVDRSGPFQADQYGIDCLASITSAPSVFRLGLYEPRPEFLPYALGLDLVDANGVSALSDSQIAEFKSLPNAIFPEDPVQVGLVEAYRKLKSLDGFRPNEMKAKDLTGCSGICVATEALPLKQSRYSATYKKVYNFGTPSARLIVLRESSSGLVVGVIALNVAETVSAIHEFLWPVLAPNTEITHAIYDRNWLPMGMISEPSSFDLRATFEGIL